MGEVRRRAGRPGSQLRRGPARVRRYRVAPRTPGCAAQLLAQLAEAGAPPPPAPRPPPRRSAPLPGTTGVFPASAEVDASVVGTDSGRATRGSGGGPTLPAGGAGQGAGAQ